MPTDDKHLMLVDSSGNKVDRRDWAMNGTRTSTIGWILSTHSDCYIVDKDGNFVVNMNRGDDGRFYTVDIERFECLSNKQNALVEMNEHSRQHICRHLDFHSPDWKLDVSLDYGGVLSTLKNMRLFENLIRTHVSFSFSKNGIVMFKAMKVGRERKFMYNPTAFVFV